MRKRFSESEIINLLRAIEVKISGDMGTEEACRSLGVSDKSYYRWHKLYGSTGHGGRALQGPGEREWAITQDRVGP